ncbi:unnamed protein product, partial [Rotaria sp. Silwood2]
KALTSEQYAKVTKQKSLVRLDERYKMICSVVDECQLNNDSYLEKCCLIVNAMLKYCIQFNLSSIEKFEAGVPQTILVHMNELKM